MRPRHLKLLQATAIRTARKYGEVDTYFTKSRFYALQQKFMRRNIVITALGLKAATMNRFHDFERDFGARVNRTAVQEAALAMYPNIDPAAHANARIPSAFATFRR